ncbi:MAG: hypothetical protein WAV48_05035 [Candidatus Magasanikiibacteriota bacterium]
MLFIPENRDDINRYYRGTFVKFRETGDALFYVKHVGEDKVSGTGSDGTPFELLLHADFPYEVDYILPKKSFFQYGPYACLLQRIPAKQYQRGISEANTLVQMLGNGNGVVSLTFETLQAFVAKQAFLSLSQALEEKDKTSVVLSPRLGLVCATRKIFADMKAIGQVKLKENKIQSYHKIFKPELEQLALGTHFKVV